MKKIASLLFFLLLSLIVVSQEKQLEYTAEVAVDNATAKQLHDRCMDWFSNSFNHPNPVPIESTDDILIALPYLIYYPNFDQGNGPIMGTITYTFEVIVREGKYTYVINNFVHHGNPKSWNRTINFGLITTARKSPIKFPNQAYSERIWNDIKYQINERMEVLIDDLKSEMAGAPEKKIME